MEWKFAFLILLVTVIIYLVACSNSSVADPVTWVSNNIAKPLYLGSSNTAPTGINAVEQAEDGAQPFTLGGSDATSNSVNSLQVMEHASTTEETIPGDVTLGGVTVYDPIQQGAIAPSEVESHYQHQDEASPFATVGAADTSKVIRTDDPYALTGVPWVFRPPCRTHATILGGPQAGARQTPSDSSASIVALHRKGKCKSYVW